MAKKDNTLLWVLGLAGVGAVAYFGFVKPKQVQQKQLTTTSAGESEADILRAKAALIKEQAKAAEEARPSDLENIFGFFGGVAEGIWG